MCFFIILTQKMFYRCQSMTGMGLIRMGNIMWANLITENRLIIRLLYLDAYMSHRKKKRQRELDFDT